jgi:hypothetical protein
MFFCTASACACCKCTGFRMNRAVSPAAAFVSCNATASSSHIAQLAHVAPLSSCFDPILFSNRFTALQVPHSPRRRTPTLQRDKGRARRLHRRLRCAGGVGCGTWSGLFGGYSFVLESRRRVHALTRGRSGLRTMPLVPSALEGGALTPQTCETHPALCLRQADAHALFPRNDRWKMQCQSVKHLS